MVQILNGNTCACKGKPKTLAPYHTYRIDKSLRTDYASYTLDVLPAASFQLCTVSQCKDLA